MASRYGRPESDMLQDNSRFELDVGTISEVIGRTKWRKSSDWARLLERLSQYNSTEKFSHRIDLFELVVS